MNREIVLLCLALIALVFCVFYAFYNASRDEHNGPQKTSLDRSTVYVDEQTGCEYLGGTFGPAVPRTNGQGVHLGCR